MYLVYYRLSGHATLGKKIEMNVRSKSLADNPVKITQRGMYLLPCRGHTSVESLSLCGFLPSRSFIGFLSVLET
jgi:hypothetical protein